MIFNLFLFLCFYLPFQIALNPAAGVDLASIRVLILMLFFVWVYDNIRNKKKLFFLDTQVRLILFFLFLSVASLFFAQNYGWGARKLLYLFSILPLYFVVKDILNSREKVIKTLKSLVLSGAIVSIFGIIQFFAQFFWNYENISKLYSTNFLGRKFGADGVGLSKLVSGCFGAKLFSRNCNLSRPAFFFVVFGNDVAALSDFVFCFRKEGSLDIFFCGYFFGKYTDFFARRVRGDYSGNNNLCGCFLE